MNFGVKKSDQPVRLPCACFSLFSNFARTSMSFRACSPLYDTSQLREISFVNFLFAKQCAS